MSRPPPRVRSSWSRFAPTAFVAGVAFVALASGCSSATHTGARPRTGLRPPAATVHAHGVIVPPVGSPRLIHREEAGAAYYAVGGIRVTLRESGTVVGEQPFASPLVGAAPLRAGGWLFVAQSGTVAKAQEFTGTMTYVRTLPATVVRAFAWEGGLAAALSDGRIVRADAEHPERAPNVLPASALESPAAAPRDAPEFESSQVAQAAVEHFPAARLALGSSTLLGNGTVAVRGGDRLYFATVSTGRGFSPVGVVPLPSELTGECDLTPWGVRALITCPALREDMPDALQTITPFVVRQEGVERVGATGLGAILAGREGHTLTRRGPCPNSESPPEQPGPRGPTYSCTLDQDRDWREWQFPGNARVIDVYDGYALVTEIRAETTVLELFQIDLGRVIGPPLVSDPALQIARAGFTPDGRILVLAQSGTEQTPAAQRRSQVGIAAAGEVITLHSVGFFARDVAMGDAQHGIAIGANAHEVVETLNGGISWMRVDVALDGDPARVSLGPSAATAEGGAPGGNDRVRRNGELVDCSPLACRVEGKLVHWWDEAASVVPAME